MKHENPEQVSAGRAQTHADILPLQRFLNDCAARLANFNDGAVANYIPELSKANATHFGIALTTVDGHIHETGDARVDFTMQSVSKAFVYALAIEFCGHKEVAETIGVEPSGDSFNSIRLGSDNRPFNPMVNAGAIACTGLIYNKDPHGAFERIRQCLSGFAARDFEVDEAVYQSESRTGDRNRAIAWLLRNNGVLKGDVESSIDVYFRQCAILANACDLSVMGATLANNGINPVTGQQVIAPLTAARVLSIMVSSGMYDYSGEWIYRVGLPAKSGVGGGIVAALPGQLGLGTFSPPLDSLGNSARGLRVCEEVSSHFALHVLQRQVDVRSAIAATYDISNAQSHRDRRREDQLLLERFGHTAHVAELAGAINFVSCDYICRELLAEAPRGIQVVDFRRVSGISTASAELFSSLFEDLSNAGTRVVVTGLSEDGFAGRTLLSAMGEDLKKEIRRFEALTDGTAWAEDQLVYRHGGFSQLSNPVDLAEQPLLADLSKAQIEELLDVMHVADYAGGTKIVNAEDAADSIYFLTRGMVSIVLDSGVRVATLDAGTCFGEFALIDRDTSRSASVISDSPCRCYRLTLPAFEIIGAKVPDIGATILRNVAKLLSNRLRHANAKIEALSR